MAKFMMLEIDNSAKSAVKSGKWKAPGAAFYDQLLNAYHYGSNKIPEDAEELNKIIQSGKYKSWPQYLEEAYLVAPIKNIHNSPHGVTPFSRSGCKYPHHVIRNGKLVVSVPGVKAAYARALQMGVLKGDVKKHLERHIKELGLEVSFKSGALSWNEAADRLIEENFDFIFSVIKEHTGVDLHEPSPDVFSEDINMILDPNYQKLYEMTDYPETYDNPELIAQLGGKSPDELLNWVRGNITYDDNDTSWKLRSPDELYHEKTGNCHDQSCFITAVLQALDIHTRQLFFVEYKEGSEEGGATHTLTYYTKDKKVYWIETAWDNQVGIHGPFDDVQDLIDDIMDKYEDEKTDYDGLAFFTSPSYEVGMNLQDYVSSWTFLEDHAFHTETKMKYTRLEYDGVGVYDALKNVMDPGEWKKYLTSDTFSWLPKPPSYSNTCQSWFTQEGYEKFLNTVAPLIRKYLDPDKIGTRYRDELQGKVVYQDRYQVVVDTSIVDQLEEGVLTEASHGNLKVDHRLCIAVGPKEIEGHRIHVIYSLDGIKLTQNNVVWNPKNGSVKEKRKAREGATDDSEVVLLRRYGNTDHESYGQKILAIKDIDDGDKQLKQVTVKGPFSMSTVNNKTLRVGEVDMTPSFKSTFWNPLANELNDISHVSRREHIGRMRGIDGAKFDVLVDRSHAKSIAKSSKYLLEDLKYELDECMRVLPWLKKMIARGSPEERRKYFGNCGLMYRELNLRKFHNIYLPGGSVPSKENGTTDAGILEEYKRSAINVEKRIKEIPKERKKYEENLKNAMADSPILKHGVKDRHKRILGLESVDEGCLTEAIAEQLEWITEFAHSEPEGTQTKMSDIIRDCKTPEELLNWMDCIQYGWLDKDGNINGTGDDDDTNYMWSQYRLQSPLQLIRSKVGVCWDQCELEREWFQRSKYPFVVVYIEIDDDEAKPSHTFLVYKEPGETKEVCWFEHSWGQKKGIHKFSDFSTCIETVIQQHEIANGKKRGQNPVYAHIMKKPKPGLGVIRFMSFARSGFKIDRLDIQYDDIFNEATWTCNTGGHPAHFRVDKDELLKDPHFTWIDEQPGFPSDGPVTWPIPLDYDRPMLFEELPEGLQNDPVHAWRAKTGVELIHREPTLTEMKRIWNNWQRMDNRMKKVSDEKSVEFFGMTNAVHYEVLVPKYASQAEWAGEKTDTLADILRLSDQPGPYSMSNLPRYMYHGSNQSFKTLSGKNLFLTPHPGIASCFLVPKKEIIAEAFRKEFGKEPTRVSFNAGYDAWNYEDQDLRKPLKIVKITHNIPTLTDTISGVKVGYIHVVDIDSIRDKLKTNPNTNNPDREVIYNGDDIPSEKILPVRIKYELRYDPENERLHGKGFVESVITEEGEPPEMTDPDAEKPQQEPIKESRPKKVDRAESPKNGVRRKKLYIAFIEWCKEYNDKNTFGSIFDEDAFKVSYPFVPEEMRYFYRLANPMLCVLGGELTFFPASELRKLNAKNSNISQQLIFAATSNDLRVFNCKDKKVYRGTFEAGALKLHEVLGDTFDTYIQTMIKKGNILTAPLEDE